MWLHSKVQKNNSSKMRIATGRILLGNVIANIAKRRATRIYQPSFFSFFFSFFFCFNWMNGGLSEQQHSCKVVIEKE